MGRVQLRVRRAVVRGRCRCGCAGAVAAAGGCAVGPRCTAFRRGSPAHGDPPCGSGARAAERWCLRAGRVSSRPARKGAAMRDVAAPWNSGGCAALRSRPACARGRGWQGRSVCLLVAVEALQLRLQLWVCRLTLAVPMRGLTRSVREQVFRCAGACESDAFLWWAALRPLRRCVHGDKGQAGTLWTRSGRARARRTGDKGA